MRCFWILAICVGLTAVGCGTPTGDTTEANAERGSASNAALIDSGRAVNMAGTAGQGSAAPPSGPAPIPIVSDVAQLSAENSKIQFVCAHVAEDPNPRTGVFQQFKGEATVDPATGALKSVVVEIDVESIWVPQGDLVTHLKSPDFFDVREYPNAKFESTDIAAGAAEGEFTITGNLTLLETTNEIVIPATVEVTDAGLRLNGEVTIQRAEFGMDKLLDKVENDVALTVALGEPASLDALAAAAAGGPGGGGARRGGGGPRPGGGPGGRRGFDPVAMFQNSDADGDGKLTGDEINERMRDNLAEIDTDGDGAVSLEEFQARMARFRGGPGGRGPGGGGPGATRGGAGGRPGGGPAAGADESTSSGESSE